MFFYLIFTIFCLYMISRQGHFDEWMRTAIGFPIKYGGLGFVGVSLQSDLQKYATYQVHLDIYRKGNLTILGEVTPELSYWNKLWFLSIMTHLVIG